MLKISFKIVLIICMFAYSPSFAFTIKQDWDEEYKKANIFKAVKRNDEANKIFERGCKANHAASCSSLGNSYAYGIGFAKSEENAKKYYKKSCDLGDGKACVDYIYKEDATGHSINPANITMPYLQKSCDLNYARGCGIMGTYYILNEEVKQDLPLAAKYFIKACDLKDAEPCEFMGKLYIKGAGVEPSLPKALEYFKQACGLGKNESCQLYEKYSKN